MNFLITFGDFASLAAQARATGGHLEIGEALKGDPSERWITVHPHGDSGPGQAVLVKVNPSNPRQGHIIGGAGGSMNLRRINLKTPAEYKKQAAEKRRAKRERTKEEKKSGRSSAHKQIREQHDAHKRGALSEILKLGGHSGDLAAPKEETEGLDEGAAKKAQGTHERGLWKQARAMLRDARRYLASSASARQAAGLGEMELRGGEGALGAEDILTSKELRRGLGYVAETAQLTDEEATSARVSVMRSKLTSEVEAGNHLDAGILGQRIARATVIEEHQIEEAPAQALAGFGRIAAQRLDALDATIDAEAMAAGAMGEPAADDPIPDEDREALDEMAERLGSGISDALRFTHDPQNASQVRDWLKVAQKHGLLDPAAVAQLEDRERQARFAAVGAPTPEQLTEEQVGQLEGEALKLMVQETAKKVRSTPGTDEDLRKAAAVAGGDIEALARDRANLAEEGIVAGELSPDEQRAFLARSIELGMAGAEAPDAADAGPVQDKAWQAPKIDSPEAARDILLMGRKLRELKRSAKTAAGAIDRGEDVDGIDYDPNTGDDPAWRAPKGGADEDTSDAHPHASVVEEVKQEIRTQRARSFLGDVRESYDGAREGGASEEDASADLGRHLSWGVNQAITQHAQSILRDATIDRQTVDLLGAEGSAKLLAWQIHQHRGEHMEAVGDALGEHHLQLQDSMIPEASEGAREAYEHAHEIHAGMAGETGNLSEWKAMNDARIAKLDEARSTLGRTLGHLEATAALHAAVRMGPAEEIVSQLGAVDETAAAAHAKAAGLEVEDYEIDGDGTNTWLTIKASGFAKLVRPVDEQGMRQTETVQAIKRGDHDEDGWMPHGFAERSDPAPYEGPPAQEHAQDFDHGLQRHESMHEAMKSFVAERVHDGWRPLDIVQELQRTGHHEAEIRKAHADADHEHMPGWRAQNPEPPKSDGMDMFGGGGPSAEWSAWDESRAQVAASPRVNEFQQALEQVAPSRRPLGDTKLSTLEMAEKYAPTFNQIAEEHAAGLGDAQTLHGQQLDEDHAHDASFRALARHPAAVGAFKDPKDLSHEERAALRDAFHRYHGRKAGEAGPVEHPNDRIKAWDEENPEPERTAATMGMFGAMGMSEQATPEEIQASSTKVDEASAQVDEAYARHHAAGQAVHAAEDRAGGQTGIMDASELTSLKTSHAQAQRALEEAHRTHEQAQGAHFDLQHRDASPEWKAWKKERGSTLSGYQREHAAAAPPDWRTYVATHGSADAAYRALQDQVKGRFLDDFAGHYQALAGSPLKTGVTSIAEADRHRIAFDPDWRAHVGKVQGMAAAQVHDRDGAGRFVQDQVKAKRDRVIQESRAAKERQTTAFDAPVERAATPGVDERRTLGRAAEEQLSAIVEKHADVIDPSQPFAARTASFSGGESVKRQRAIKMIAAIGKTGLYVGTGGGKTSIALGALSHLRGEGRAERGLFAVPSIVQGQFGSEALSFIDPKSMRWHARPGEKRAERLAALANPEKHAVVMTHQSLRDDVTHLVAKNLGLSERDTATLMTGYDENGEQAETTWSREEMDGHVREALEKHGGAELLHYLAVDEGDIALNRAGKRDSHMARVIDSLMRQSKHGAMMTGTPVKNDASELYDQLAKVAHNRYHEGEGGVSRAAFLRRYGSDPAAAGHALRGEMDRYSYTAEVGNGLTPNNHQEQLKPTATEASRAKEIAEAYARVSDAGRRGEVDVDAARQLVPHYFEGEEDEAAIQGRAETIHKAAAPFRDHALNHAFNIQEGAKVARIQELAKKYKAEGRPGGVVFARNHGSVEAIRGALEKDGHRVITLTGKDSSKAKDEKRDRFNGGHADIIVLSDAGSSGANLQHQATWLVHHDQPQTYRTWKQRTARIVRHGQGHQSPDIHSLAVEHEWEDRNRDRLERKKALHEMVFDGQDEIHDDSGLAGLIREHLRARTAVA